MIEYTFKLRNGSVFAYKIDPDRQTDFSVEVESRAAWTELRFCQCPNCPLSPPQYRYCPPALDLQEIAANFSNIISYENVHVEVKTQERTYTRECDAQTALRSLLGLIMASSACPVLSQLKALVYYHLPFANLDETLFRSVSAYLVKQFFVYREGGQPDWDLVGLAKLYQDLEMLNTAFKERVHSASRMDASMNAVGALFFLSMAVNISLEDRLKDLKPRFSSMPLL